MSTVFEYRTPTRRKLTVEHLDFDVIDNDGNAHPIYFAHCSDGFTMQASTLSAIVIAARGQYGTLSFVGVRRVEGGLS